MDGEKVRLCEEIDVLEERVRELEEALRPFAEVLPAFTNRPPSKDSEIYWFRQSDVDRARRALEGGK